MDNLYISIKSCYSYLHIFYILPPIISLYTLTIATLYKHLYIKYIEITYKGSLYFAIPNVLDTGYILSIYLKLQATCTKKSAWYENQTHDLQLIQWHIDHTLTWGWDSDQLSQPSLVIFRSRGPRGGGESRRTFRDIAVFVPLMKFEYYLEK